MKNAMLGIEVIVMLMFLRVILPVALLLWNGARVQQQEVKYQFR